MNNCIAEPLARRDIRTMAKKIRLIEGCSERLYFDVMHFLEITLPKIDENFTFRVRPLSEMGDCHGLTYPDKNEIHIREDVYERACNGVGRDRLTMAHELFHLLQHEKENISFARIGDFGKIPTYMDPEWQATAFGGELLIPHDLVKGMSAEEVASKCKVSLQAAKYQLTKY
ncbi:MAG: ImmA/IrrE family metallo-endopeptidase [Agathobacter sp.]